MERIAMSQQERDWLEWLKRAQDGVITQRQAAEKMGITDRWVRRLLARMEAEGDPVGHLVRLIDDATSRSWGRFVQHDGTRENMGVLWEYLERNGRMVDVYTDRDSMFAVAPRPGESEQERREADRVTQIGRALR